MKRTDGPPAILVAGRSGRMSQRLLVLADDDPQLRCLGSVGREDDAQRIAEADVLIDFTTPTNTLRLLALCRAVGTHMVIGTTGLSASQNALIRAAGADIAICCSANFSLGVNVLYRLVAEAATVLGTRFDIEVLELHHRDKQDAPSGTALELGARLARARNLDLTDSAVYARHGLTGARLPGSIGFQSLRGGDVAGEHSVLFLGEGERLELTHKAGNRDIFARGALNAAKSIINKNNGLFEFIDLVM